MEAYGSLNNHMELKESNYKANLEFRVEDRQTHRPLYRVAQLYIDHLPMLNFLVLLSLSGPYFSGSLSVPAI